MAKTQAVFLVPSFEREEISVPSVAHSVFHSWPSQSSRPDSFRPIL